MTGPLGSLKIDHWYKALLVAGAAFLLLSLTVPFQGISNRSAALVSLGVALWGLGEWINHPYQEAIGPSPIGWGKLSGHPRCNTLLGNLVVLGGVLCLGYGIWKLVTA